MITIFNVMVYKNWEMVAAFELETDYNLAMHEHEEVEFGSYPNRLKLEVGSDASITHHPLENKRRVTSRKQYDADEMVNRQIELLKINGFTQARQLEDKSE